MGLTELFDDLSVERLHRWHETKKPQPAAYPGVANALAMWIKNQCEEALESLAARF